MTANIIISAKLLLMDKQYWDDQFKSAETQDMINNNHDWTNSVIKYQNEVKNIAKQKINKLEMI